MTETYIGCTTGGKKKEPKQTVLQRWRVLHRQGLIAFTQGNTEKGIKFLGMTSTRPIPLYNAKKHTTSTIRLLSANVTICFHQTRAEESVFFWTNRKQSRFFSDTKNVILHTALSK